jgi:hypothetical protein
MCGLSYVCGVVCVVDVCECGMSMCVMHMWCVLCVFVYVCDVWGMSVWCTCECVVCGIYV